MTHNSIQTKPELYFLSKDPVKCFIAVGSNVGDRYRNITLGLQLLESTNESNLNLPTTPSSSYTKSHSSNPTEAWMIQIMKTSFLYETSPMYVFDQGYFINGMIEIHTRLSPHALLQRCKDIERQVGRDLDATDTLRYGPRPLDLDIIYYGISPLRMESEAVPPSSHAVTHGSSDKYAETGTSTTGGSVMHTSDLIIPHPRMTEREFVLFPLNDLDPSIRHPLWNISSLDLLQRLVEKQDDTNHSITRVIPLPRERFLRWDHHKPLLMGILNLTPDSFSDGGKYDTSTEHSINHALQLVNDGADIIDLGGESTRPGSKEVPTDIELNRVIPFISRLREILPHIPLSIDTRHSIVAKSAIQAGADIVNDVSGGCHDPNMLSTVSQLHVPYILMHMRGNPETMQRMTQYKDHIVPEVASALVGRSQAAERAGIPRWLQILDPGIGFAKNMEQNLSLIRHRENMVQWMKANFPILMGPSRKGFIGTITGEMKPEERDFGTAAACIMSCLQRNGTSSSSPTIVRVHNVRGIRQALKVMDAIQTAK